MLSIRFYIGRVQSDGQLCQPSQEFEALALLSRAYPDGLTRTDARGIWQGAEEPSIVVEAIVLGMDLRTVDIARSHAGEIAFIMHQSCIGVAFADVAFELVKP